jgi:hypothetical protein
VRSSLRSPVAPLRRVLAFVRLVPVPLRLLLGIAAVLSVSWNVAVPPLQGFDEPDHVAYVARLAETGAPPSVTSGNASYAPDEAAALGPLGFLRLTQNPSARPPWQSVAEDSFGRFEQGLPPGASGAAEGPNPLAKNPPLYYALEAIGWRLTPGGAFFDRLFVLRLGSGLMFLAAVAFAWLAASELFRRQLPRVVATGVVALQPMVTYESAIVNTDILQLTGWCAFLWLGLRAARLGPSPLRLALPAVAAAATVMTHGRGIAILPAFLVLLAVVVLRHRPSVRRGAGAIAVPVGIVAATVIAYRIYSSAAGGAALYGGEVNFGPASSFSIRQFLSFVWQFYLPELSSMDPRIGPAYGFRQVWVETLWGSFGAYEVTLPGWVNDLVQVSLVLLLVAIFAVVVRRVQDVLVRWPQVVILAAVGSSLLAVLHLASYRALLGGSNDPLITGRYLLPIVPLLGIGAAAVVASLPRRAAPFAAVGLLVLLTALTLTGLGLTVARFDA